MQRHNYLMSNYEYHIPKNYYHLENYNTNRYIPKIPKNYYHLDIYLEKTDTNATIKTDATIKTNIIYENKDPLLVELTNLDEIKQNTKNVNNDEEEPEDIIINNL